MLIDRTDRISLEKTEARCQQRGATYDGRSLWDAGA
jgi:hypothetical protein